MHRGAGKTLIILAGAFAVSALPAQDLSNYTSFTVDGKTVQFHGFVSEGFAYSNDNNYLTMDTSQGSFFTDGGVNVSTQLTDKFRVGAQVYDHNIGTMGKWHPQLDWALADYRFKDWFGIRAGKVKTPLGLFNDTQDQSFLYTWALLPQSVYPVDLRSMTIAHVGADVYGAISLRKGSLSYEGYAGTIPDDPYGGFTYGLEDLGVKMNGGISGRTEGVDLRWNTPLDGLFFGASLALNQRDWKGRLKGFPVSYDTDLDRVTAYYGEYSKGRVRFDAEYRGTIRDAYLHFSPVPVPIVNNVDETGWYVAGSWRFSKRFEVGSYYSDYEVSSYQNPQISKRFTGPGANYIHDPVLTAHFNLTSAWDLKVEGHFMQGIGSNMAHGFYASSNPQGLQPQTNLLVLRTGWNF